MRYAILDTQDRDQVIASERAFYATFHPIAGDLIRRLWHWDHAEKRLRTAIPYGDQIVYLVINDQDVVVGGLAVNVAMNAVQSAEYGFRIPGETSATDCELLAFFMVDPHHNGLRFHRQFFREHCCRDLVQRGYRMTYGTTAPKPLPVYLRIGARILEEKSFGPELRYFFEIPLEARTTTQRVAKVTEPAAPAPLPASA